MGTKQRSPQAIERDKANKWRHHLRNRYGIDEKQWQAINDKQGGVCAICDSPPKKRRLHTDHDHKTGQIRGILCFSCNYGLRWFKDKASLLSRAARYIETSQEALKRHEDDKDEWPKAA